jgi:hypothetical protein
METYTAIRIDRPAWEVMTALDPHFEELSFEENAGRYLVLNFLNDEPNPGPSRWAIMTEELLLTNFEFWDNRTPFKSYTVRRK